MGVYISVLETLNLFQIGSGHLHLGGRILRGAYAWNFMVFGIS